MPNPRHGNRNDLPLDESVGYATHVRIVCSPATCNPPCNRAVVWLVSDLVAKLPRCRTMGEFTNKLYCRNCKRPGWVRIEAVGR